MNWIGLIPADDLPSSSVALRVSEMKRLGFSEIILYTQKRTFLARQFDVKSITDSATLVQELKAQHADLLMNTKFRLDGDALKALGEPKEKELVCLCGSKVINTTLLGTQQSVAMITYNRLRLAARYTQDDTGAIQVDTCDYYGPIGMTTTTAVEMLEVSDKWLQDEIALMSVVNMVHANITVADPLENGVSWHTKRITGKRPTTTNVVPLVPYVKYQERVEPRSVETGVIVSMTTYRKRFPILKKSLGSILNQTVQPEKVCIAIDSCDFDYIPDYLKRLEAENRIEILQGDKSLGPHNKYVHAMRKYPTKAVITFDDDMVYRANAIQELVSLYKKYPNCICARRAHLIRYDSLGVPLPYRQWVNQCQDIAYPSSDLCATGVGGVLYPPNLFKWTDETLEEMRVLRNDDLYLKKKENDLGVKTVCTCSGKDSDSRITDFGVQDLALYNINVRQGNNDIEIKQLSLTRPGNEAPVPFFRIIIPVYKSVKTLKRALDSIKRQTFTEYKVIVCDDGSPKEEALANEATVKEFGDKGEFILHDTNLFAGKARNDCQTKWTNAAYTLYLDADDKFAYDNLFKDLHQFILDNQYPDLVILPWIKRDGSSTKNLVTSRKPTVASVSTDRRFEVPWCKCVKTSKVKPFQENLRRCNDVLNHYKVLDDCATVALFNTAAVRYMPDSDTTMFGVYGKKNRANPLAFTSYLQCVDALITTEWVHDYVRKTAALEAEYILRYSIPNFLESIGPDPIYTLMRSRK